MQDESNLTVKTGDSRAVGNRMRLNRMKKINEASHTGIHRAVVLMTYIYLALPIIIFLLGWCRPLVGIPLAGVCVWSLVLCFRKRENYIELDWKLGMADKWRLAVIAAVIFMWVALSGIGGYVWQNGDHAWRNGILHILVDYEWPPAAGERGLTYYIGTWLPAALAGRALGMEEAQSALFLWVLLGVCLAYALICVWKRKIVLWPLVIFIFFSGLDIIGYNMFADNAVGIFGPDHLEWWLPRHLYEYQYSSNTTQLFWVFNQSVPAWLGTMLLFMDESPKNMIWVCSLVAITSTLPLIGMVPIMIYYMIRRSKWQKPESVTQGWKMVSGNMASFQNLAGGGSVLVISFLYLTGNDNFTIASFAGGEDGARLSVWLPWIILLAIAVLLLLLGTLVIWIWEKERGRILRNIVCLMVTFVLVILFFEALGTEKVGGNDVFRLICVILFVLLDVGIYVYLLYKDVEDKGLFNIVAISLMVIPFFKIGSSGDFCMRASIPGLYIVMLWCIETLGKKRKYLRVIILVTCLAIGAVTPIHEIKRTVINSRDGYSFEMVEEERILNAANFSGSLNTFFWRYIARKK